MAKDPIIPVIIDDLQPAEPAWERGELQGCHRVRLAKPESTDNRGCTFQPSTAAPFLEEPDDEDRPQVIPPIGVADQDISPGELGSPPDRLGTLPELCKYHAHF